MKVQLSFFRLLFFLLFCGAPLSALPQIASDQQTREINIRLTYLDMLLERIFLSMIAKYPLDSVITEPTCENSSKFQDNIATSQGRPQFRETAYKRGMDNIQTQATGPHSIWPVGCKPLVFVLPPIQQLIREKAFRVRIPRFVDMHAYLAEVKRVLQDLPHSFDPYVMPRERAIFIRKYYSPEVSSALTHGYPALDRAVNQGLVGVPQWIDLATAPNIIDRGLFVELEFRIK